MTRRAYWVLPGDHIGTDGFFRLGYGEEREVLEKGLALFFELLDSVAAHVGSVG